MWWLHAVASANESCRGSPFRSEWALSREAGKVPGANSCKNGLCRVYLPSCQLSPQCHSLLMGTKEWTFGHLKPRRGYQQCGQRCTGPGMVA